ncbi:MAG: AAA family ATPase [Pseudomonadota bacterium]
MYTQFFQLNQAPFSIAPDPSYLFMSERHREALAHLLYGVGSGGGFVLLTGEIGAGKTTVCRCFLEQIPANCNIAYIFNPKLTVNELLQSICNEFGAVCEHDGAGEPSVKDYVDALNIYLLATHAGRQNNVLIIDEAQNLSADVLEQLRLLTNLETNERKLLQIILIGQPELRQILNKPELEQLAQRVIARYHLDLLSEPETAHYIQHRLAIGGLAGASPFSGKVMKRIHRRTRGVPRRINLLCDRAMLGAYAEGDRVVSRTIVDKAAHEVFGNDEPPGPPANRYWGSAALGLVLAAAIAVVVLWSDDAVPFVQTITTKKALPVAAASALAAGAAAGGNAGAAALTPPAVNKENTGSGKHAPAILEDLKEVLGGSTAQDENSAQRELAQLWGVTLAEGDACLAAKQNELHCYKSGGGLTEIRRLGRPAILALRDGNNNIHHVMLAGLGDSSANLRIGGKNHLVTLVELGRHFNGNFATLWRAPQMTRATLAAGDRGADVDRFAAQLAKVNGAPPLAENQMYGVALAKLVREFQAAQGLEIDGVAGAQTMMHLNNAAGVNEPHLKTPSVAVTALSGK